jgi:hypothetical protein
MNALSSSFVSTDRANENARSVSAFVSIPQTSSIPAAIPNSIITAWLARSSAWTAGQSASAKIALIVAILRLISVSLSENPRFGGGSPFGDDPRIKGIQSVGEVIVSQFFRMRARHYDEPLRREWRVVDLEVSRLELATFKYPTECFRICVGSDLAGHLDEPLELLRALCD